MGASRLLDICAWRAELFRLHTLLARQSLDRQSLSFRVSLAGVTIFAEWLRLSADMAIGHNELPNPNAAHIAMHVDSVNEPVGAFQHRVGPLPHATIAALLSQ